MRSLVEVKIRGKGKKYYCTPENFKKGNYAKNKDILTYRTVKLTMYQVDMWIHPKVGGDDYQVTRESEYESIKECREVTEKYLRRISNVIDDYQIKKI